VVGGTGAPPVIARLREATDKATTKTEGERQRGCVIPLVFFGASEATHLKHRLLSVMDDVIRHNARLLEDGKGCASRPTCNRIACTVCALVFVGLLQEREPDSWLTLSGYGYLPAGAIWSGK
jgi:hypothetical protein